MAGKKGNATEAKAEAVVDRATEDHRARIDLNDPNISGQEAVERALGYRMEEPKAE